LDLVLDLNYFSFPHPNPNPNPTHLLKHESPSPNNQFSQRIWYVEYYSVHKYMAWSQRNFTWHRSRLRQDSAIFGGDRSRRQKFV